MSEPRLRAESLSCGYPGRRVLESVTLTVDGGEVIALLGPNGSGKSTLLKTLSGTLRPLGGHAYVEGENLFRLSERERARRIAMVPQEERTPFDYTAREIVLMGRLAHSDGLFETRHDHEVAEAAMREADCAHLMDRYYEELSGGERQRVLIARALAQESPVLLLDEPTAHLDVGHQVEVAALLRRLAEKGYAILLAAHDLNWAGETATSGVLLDGGRIRRRGSIAELLRSSDVDEVYGVRFERSESLGRLRLWPLASPSDRFG